MRRASRVFSISGHTTRLAARYTPGLREGTVVPLCTEPPDPVAGPPYRAAEREAAVLIVGWQGSAINALGNTDRFTAVERLIGHFRIAKAELQPARHPGNAG